MSDSKIGIAIATFNSAAVIARCLSGLSNGSFKVVLFDDGSSDDTVAVARSIIPDIELISGQGKSWWAGGTRKAVERCLDLGCDFVVLLNPDVEMTDSDVRALIAFALEQHDTMVAPLVVDRCAPEKIAWAGSHFRRLPWLPIYTARYVARRGAPVPTVGAEPYEVDEAHGRGVVLSRRIIDRIGMFDVDTFPHYGADSDYSLRARREGLTIKVLPAVRVSLATTNSGMSPWDSLTLADRLRTIRAYLLEQKNGDALRVWWHLMSRHVPWYAVVPSYIFNVGTNVLRRLQ